MNSLRRWSDAQRAAVTDPVIRNLIDLIPRANFSMRPAHHASSAQAPPPADVNT